MYDAVCETQGSSRSLIRSANLLKTGLLRIMETIQRTGNLPTAESKRHTASAGDRATCTIFVEIETAMRKMRVVLGLAVDSNLLLLIVP